MLVWTIDAFIDIKLAEWTIPSACERADGVRRLLPRIADLEPKDLHPMVRHKLFADALVHAARRGDLAAVQWLMEEYLPTGRVRHAIESAARHGQLHILQWLRECHSQRVVWRRKELLLAVRGDHFETAKWLFTHVPPELSGWDAACMVNCALGNGNLALLDWMYLIGPAAQMVSCSSLLQCPRGSSFLSAAVGSGRVGLAQWLYDHGSTQLIDGQAISRAAESGNLEMIKWVFGHCAIDDKLVNVGAAITNAAWNGHLDIVKFLHQHTPRSFSSCWSDAMEAAAEGVHFAVVKYLYDKCGSRYLGNPIDTALHNKNIEIIKWLFERVPMKFRPRAMNSAAAAGHLDVVMWLHEIDSRGPTGVVECTSAAMNLAARSNHLEIVQFLHENRLEGCTTTAMDDAAANGHLEMLEWLFTHRYEGCTAAAMDEAAGNGHLKVVKWLHEHASLCTTRAMDSAASNGHLDIVEWLQENRHEGCTTRALEGAASNGRLEVIKWLLSHGREGNIHLAFAAAAANGHLEVIKWFCHHQGQDPRSISLWLPARSSHTHVIAWLVTHAPLDSVSILESAIREGHLSALIAQHGVGLLRCSPELFQCSIWDQQLEILQWLLIEFPGQSLYDASNIPPDPYVRDAFNQAGALRHAA